MLISPFPFTLFPSSNAGLPLYVWEHSPLCSWDGGAWWAAVYMSDSVRPRRWKPTRLLCPWDSPGKNTGVGSFSLLQGIFPTQGLNPGFPHCRQILYQLSYQGSLVEKQPAAAAAAKSLQSCPTLYNPIDGSPPGSSVPGILQARTLEWVAISFSNA